MRDVEPLLAAIKKFADPFRDRIASCKILGTMRQGILIIVERLECPYDFELGDASADLECELADMGYEAAVCESVFYAGDEKLGEWTVWPEVSIKPPDMTVVSDVLKAAKRRAQLLSREDYKKFVVELLNAYEEGTTSE